MHVVIDNREQTPFPFEDSRYSKTITSRICLPTGDYSIRGLEEYIAIERKSLADLVQCLGKDRDRFERELIRGRGLEFFAVVCEGSFRDLANGNYKSELKPHSAAQSIAAFMARHNVPFFFAESRAAAEYITWSLLRQYIKGKQNELESINKAMFNDNE